jgi:hypothetical protein
MTSTTLTLSMDNHYAIHKHDDQAHFNVNIWADIIRDTVMVLSAIIIYSKQFYWAVLKVHPLAERHRLWFQHDGDIAHYMKMSDSG